MLEEQIRRDAGVLDLEGEKVMEWSMEMPGFSSVKKGGKWLQRYYQKVEEVWKKRWLEEMYWGSCIALMEEKQFVPWQMSLVGELILLEEDFVSVAMTVVEKSQKRNHFYFGDLWKQGVPVSAKKCDPFVNRSRKEIVAQIQGMAQEKQDFSFLTAYLELIHQEFSYKNICFRPEGAEVFFPQGSIAGRVEAVPKFLIPYSSHFR